MNIEIGQTLDKTNPNNIDEIQLFLNFAFVSCNQHEKAIVEKPTNIMYNEITIAIKTFIDHSFLL